ALVAGKRAVGCDVSPLAIFAATHHCDANGVDTEELLARAEDLVASAKPRRRAAKDVDEALGGGPWQRLRRAIGEAAASRPVQDALWFVFAVAIRTAGAKSSEASAEDPEGRLAEPYFLSAAYRYAARLQALRQACSGLAEDSNNQAPLGAVARGLLHLERGDNRHLELKEPVDAVLSSPPYPGVYDYLATARLARQAVLGAGEGYEPSSAFLQSTSADFDSGKEIGNRRLWSRSPAEFVAHWQSQQESWLRSVHRNLTAGGAVVLMIGDGDAEDADDSDKETADAIDCLSSTVAAGKAVGFELIATATIESVADAAHQTKGMLRTEHMVYFRKARAAHG
ncbi:unnamed protein product, partial [Polarella glacialis]